MSLQVKQRPVSRKPPQTAPAGGDGALERQRLWMMMLIRRFEERTYQEYTKPGQRIGGFCHLYSGQEAVAVGIASIFQKEKDYLINAYRDHGHSLALGMDPNVAMAEMFGRTTGCSKGKGGSMHFFDSAAHNMGGHGIVGGHLPLGVGIAFSCWYKKTKGVCFNLFGDGAVNQGTFNEAMNLASLMKLPCLFICENNGMAMGTHVHRSSAEPDLAKRGLGYAMPCKNIDGNDIDEVMREVNEAAERARRGEGPSYLVANTYRYRGHSMSDAMKYRTREELEQARLRDPIVLYERRLRERKQIDDAAIEKMEQEIRDIVEAAVKFANDSPHPELSELYTDVYAEQYPLEK